jgi:hypothetical protein
VQTFWADFVGHHVLVIAFCFTPPLDHEATDDAVKMANFVMPGLDQSYKIGTVQRRFGIQAQVDVPLVGVDNRFGFGIGFAVFRQYLSNLILGNFQVFVFAGPKTTSDASNDNKNSHERYQI